MIVKNIIAILSLAIAASAWADTWTEPDTGITWTYTVINGEASLGGGSSSSLAISTSTTGAITIPSTLGVYPVTSIGNYAFSDCSGLTSVTIPGSVTSIGDRAFYKCSGLTSVTIPDSVTRIGSYAFDGCSGLTSVTIPSGVTSIGYGAFAHCSGLTSVTIPNSVTSIGDRAFYGCSGLTSVTIPDSVTSIGMNAFYNCTGLTSVTIPSGVTSIGYAAFAYCSGLTSVTIPDSVTSIGPGAFSSCGGLMSILVAENNPQYISANSLLLSKDGKTLIQGINGNVAVPDSVTSIGGDAFYGCSGLTNVTMGKGVASIGGSAFEHCSDLTNVTIPDSVTNIDFAAFADCPKLEKIMVVDGVFVVDGWLCSEHYGNSIYSGAIVNLDLSQYSIRGISGQVFEQAHMQSLILPQGLLYMGDFQFNLGSLPYIRIPASVKSIGLDCFCVSNTKIVFEGNAPVIKQDEYYNAFASCNVFVSPDSTGWDVTIPGKLFERDLASQDTTIEYYSTINIEFDGNGGVVQDDTKLVPVIGSEYDTIGALPTPTRDGSNFLGWYTMKYGGELVTPDTLMTEEMTLYAHWTVASIPSGTPILDIEKNILVSVDLNGATTVEIPNGVVGIASNAFENCANVELVSIPESVAAIPNATFANCDRLWANWYKAMAKGGDATDSVTLTVTNVVVHYVTASVPSTAVTPAEQTGLVNIIAEVTSGGPVAISSEWAEQYEGFAEKFGYDFTAALTKPSGKRDSAGNAMLVWQDFVAGTDPTKDYDVFTASITFDGSGNPVISYSPELSETETAKRTYRKFGKVKLNDSAWTEIADGEEDNYNFFKVSVEMK